MLDVDLQHGHGIDADDPAIPTALAMGRWLQAVLLQQARPLKFVVTVRVVDNAEMADLNQTYRHKTGTTNILSFPFSAPEGVDLDLPLLGDLVICLPVLQREALEQDKPLEHHWAHLLVHGCLHLLEFDHIDADEAHLMESHEIKILQQFGIPDPYFLAPSHSLTTPPNHNDLSRAT